MRQGRRHTGLRLVLGGDVRSGFLLALVGLAAVIACHGGNGRTTPTDAQLLTLSRDYAEATYELAQRCQPVASYVAGPGQDALTEHGGDIAQATFLTRRGALPLLVTESGVGYRLRDRLGD